MQQLPLTSLKITLNTLVTMSKNEGTIVPTPVRIDVTPTWAATANLIILGIECGTLKGKAIAKEELHRMASLMDQLIDNQKEEELL